MTRQPFLFLGEDHFLGRIVLDHVLVLDPLHPGAQRGEPVRLAGDRQRLTVLLAVVEQVALKTLDQLGRHFAGPRHAAVVAPGDEPRELQAADVHRVLGEVMRCQPHEVTLQECRETSRIAGITGDRVLRKIPLRLAMSRYSFAERKKRQTTGQRAARLRTATRNNLGKRREICGRDLCRPFTRRGVFLADSIAKRLAERELAAFWHPAGWPPDGCRRAAGSTRDLAESPRWGGGKSRHVPWLTCH